MGLLFATFWFIVATIYIIALSIGLYLICASEDKLTVSYQNYMLKKTCLPLKDEDFSNMHQIITTLRLIGGSLLIFVAIITGWFGYKTVVL